MTSVDPELLRPHVEKLKVWIVSEEGFGGWLDTFFRESGQYFDDYQEEHALYYTTLHNEFTTKLETEIQGWLSDEGLSESDLQVMLEQGREGEDPEMEAVIDTMINVMEYDKWISHIFELKRRIRGRRVVRARRSN